MLSIRFSTKKYLQNEEQWDMKFLLCAVNAKYIHSNPAVYSLRAYAGSEAGKNIEIAEYTINQRTEDILADIYQRKPDVIGFSCYIWNWEIIEKLLRELPKILPGVPLWLGGPEVSYDAPAVFKQFPFLTGIMVGEGEETFREVLGYYLAWEKQEERKQEQQNREDRGERTEEAEQKEQNTEEPSREGRNAKERDAEGQSAGKLRKIPGLYLQDGPTLPRALTDLDKLPFLYRDPETFANRIIYYESSRGCPYRCSYCLSSIDKKVRLRNIDIVKEELQFFLDKEVSQVKFVDRTFNCNHAHAMAIWSYLLEHDNGKTNFHFEIAADLLTEEEIALLGKMRPGLVQLEIGIQTANPQTLQAIHRVMNLDHVEKVVAAIAANHNIHQHLDLIAGLPFEDYASFARSFDRVYAMRPDQLQLGFLKVLKGSEMCERAQEFEILSCSMPPYEVLSTKWLPYADVLRLKRIEEMVELYYNSNQYRTTLPVLEQCFASPFSMFEALADFYVRKGYTLHTPARSHFYHVLLEFAAQYDKEQLPLYRRLLTYDLYLRENLKSRPDFCPNQMPYKGLIYDFYKKEEQERRFLPEYREYDYKQLARMTHLEIASRPVPDQGKEQSASEIYGILFDYQRRDPLTGDAFVQEIRLGLPITAVMTN